MKHRNYPHDAIFCDIEGCINPGGGDVANQDPYGLARLATVIDTMKAMPGAPVFNLCSGRQIPFGISTAQSIHALYPESDLAWSILENGAALVQIPRRETIWHPAITPAVKEAAIELRRILFLWIQNEIGGDYEKGKEICVSLNLKKGSKIETILELHDAVCEKIQGIPGFEVTYSKSAVDITPLGVNKGTMLDVYQQMTGVSFEDMLGIGDTKGDRPMIERVGYPAGPANADEFIRNREGIWIAPSETTAGVVEILWHFVFGVVM